MFCALLTPQRWGELLFWCLLANPESTIISWPGIDCPPPPLYPGGAINIDNNTIARSMQGRRLEGEVMRSWIQDHHGYSLDPVTAACLIRMEYTRKLDFASVTQLII